MKNIFKIVTLVAISLFFAGCPSDDTTTVEPPRDYATQYATEKTLIEDFLNTYTVSLDADNNPVFEEITNSGTQPSIMSMSNLHFKNVVKNDVTYKVYYLMFDEGLVTGEQPSAVDSVYVSYKGQFPYYKKETDINGNEFTTVKTTVFDQLVSPTWLRLDELVSGWSEILPLFKTGNYVVDDVTGSVSYSNYGNGVMFLPSGLGYYSVSVSNIPAYSPLIFNFKLMKQRWRDHDRDKILSKFEINADGSFIDTDLDTYYNHLDYDDDNDGKPTKLEIKIPDSNPEAYYSFNSIPNCLNSGIKVHLNKNCY